MTLIMVLTSMPQQLLASYDYKNLSNDKSKIINEVENVEVAKPEKGKTAKDLVANPTQPAIYTLRTDYKVQKGEKYEINYQPYVASVGEAASPEEQAKVIKKIKLPTLAGYDKSRYDDFYNIDYNIVKNAANGKGKSGDDIIGKKFKANQDFKYEAISKLITVKHVFQKIDKFEKYTNPDGTITNSDGSVTNTDGKTTPKEKVKKEHRKLSYQSGNTGSTMEVVPLIENERRGFIPEAPHITMQVPDDASEFVMEYRYNRANYSVVFDTTGGTPIDTRTYYYDQEIPKIDNKNIPKKKGSIFEGWKPSHDLESKNNKKYKSGEIIKKDDGTPSLDLDVGLEMPALDLGKDENTREKLTFTAVWKELPKADYAVQFWAEKSDHADNASLSEKYEYMGTHVIKNADTNSRPELDAEPVDGVQFPDLDDARLQKIWKETDENHPYLNKFFVYNKELTEEQNEDSENENLVKKVESTGKTVYNVYYDRRVYNLYFTKSNVSESSFYPEIWKNDKKVGEEGNPYHFQARFNQLMVGLWPNDVNEIRNFKEGYNSLGWLPNLKKPKHYYRDTPPYRLSANLFLDFPELIAQGGYADVIDMGKGQTKKSDVFDLSFGIDQNEQTMPHHIDFWLDDFDGGQVVDYDLYTVKSDTNNSNYHDFLPPDLQGFTPKTTGGRGSEFKDDFDLEDLNEEREEITAPKPENIIPHPESTEDEEDYKGKLKFMKYFPNDDSKEFDKNGYLRFEYFRNKYKLRFNYDPSRTKDDSEFNKTNSLETFYEFPLKALSPDLVDKNLDKKDKDYYKKNPKNLIDNPKNLQKLGLTGLVFTDKKDNELKVKRPEGLSDKLVFKGWALDPAGNKLISDINETMPAHNVVLYAKWGEPNNKWKVTFDPDGGKLKSISEEKLTTERKTIQEGDVGQEEENTYAKKGYLKEAPTTQDGKQIFTVIQKQKLVKPKDPERKGYYFMGWEIIRYKKGNDGEYTTEVDDSYRKAYRVPELYTFGNDVVAPVYLKAIWVPNEKEDVKVYHHLLDKNCAKTNGLDDPLDILEDKKTGYYTATVGDQQGQRWILAPDKELRKSQDPEIKKLYEKYNNEFHFNNSYFQNQRIEPLKIKDPNSGKMIENPNYKGNEFHFFYRPYRYREVKVNYIDKRGKKEIEDFYKDLGLEDTAGLTGDALLKAQKANKKKFKANKQKLEDIIKKYQVIDPENVSNGNRHFDARNYRPIPGWVLSENEKTQQQLFYDVNEDTNEFLGINGTGGDQIFFYYKDVRVIEVPGNQEPPKGYVRVTFKADKGGSFTDNKGNSVTELHYDVIKGLKSDLLPVPQELKHGETKTDNKQYITPETGKKFVEWKNGVLLNKDTIVNGNHTFTAYFEWSGLSASGLVRTEAFKDDKADAKKDWTNKFAPTIDELKAQLVWKGNGTIPAGTTVKLFVGNTELTTDEQVYELVNEKKKADTEELVRTVNVKAKVTFTNGKDPQELDIPIKVYKNVYEALTGTEKPLFLSQAEKGELKDVTGNYVKVTVAPTGDLKSKDNKVYYVNPRAWVEIPTVDTTDNSNFTNWTANKKAQNEKSEENGVYDFTKRHKFTEATVISPKFAEDVVEQKDSTKKPKVPENYVKVIVKTTDKATKETAFEKTFWVNPTREVAISVTNPTGKTVNPDPKNVGAVGYTMKFSKWETENKAKTWEDKIVGKFEKETTIIAKYSVEFEKIKDQVPTTDTVHTPQGKTPTVDEIKGKITPPQGKTIKEVKIVESPNVDNPGESKVKVVVEYTDGSSVGTTEKPIEIPVQVHEPIIPAKADGSKPEGAMDNYVKVTFKAGTGGTVSGNLAYYVSPDVEVDMTESAGKITKTPSVGYVSGNWDTSDKNLKDTFKSNTEFTFNFTKSSDIVEKTDENPNKPDGYVTVTFRTEDANKGMLSGDVEEKVYYVNPEANITLKDLKDNEQANSTQLAVPKAIAKPNFKFSYWQENIDDQTPITGDREYVAIFADGQVTLTYNAGGATGDVPAEATINVGKSLRLENLGNLKKENAVFAGWKIGDKTYQPGYKVTLNADTTATAQWKTAKYKVTFDTNGGSDVPSQTVEHGKPLTNVTTPKLNSKVFMGWKEKGKENEKDYFDLTTPITSDKTLIAIWQDSVQKINENDTVESQFIKVTFKQGKHGKLKLADAEQTKPVTYKVAKDLTFDKAVKAGMTVPGIAPDKYYKAKTANHGWDKKLELNGQNVEFTEQYEPQADVIPVDPKVTDDDKLQEEKPEGMVLVEFVVDDSKAFMLATSKFYVAINKDVIITPPTVYNRPGENIFSGWEDVTLNSNKLLESKFTKDKVISPKGAKIVEMEITEPKAGLDFVAANEKSLAPGVVGKLEIIRENKKYIIESQKYTSTKKIGRRTIKQVRFGFNIPKEIGKLKSGDIVRNWAIKGSMKSNTREITVK